MRDTSPENSDPLLINQKQIAARYGLSTTDILTAVQKRRAGFPMPVRVIGKKRWFRRSEIAKYFGSCPENGARPDAQ